MSTITITVGVLAENGTEALERYLYGEIPLLEQVGVKILDRCQGREMLVGADLFYLVSVMEFPSVHAMKQFLSTATILPWLCIETRHLSELESFIFIDVS
jgi:uncharacterized protein (DUF1330 family)